MSIHHIEHDKLFHPPSPSPTAFKLLSSSDQIIFLKTLYCIISWSGDCGCLLTTWSVDHIDWNTLCQCLRQNHNIALSEEQAKSLWYGLAYGTSELENDSSDELLFQTQGKGFLLEQVLKERTQKSNQNGFLTIDYPYFVSSNALYRNLSLGECDLIRMQNLCSSSVLSPVDFAEDYVVRETHSDRYLEEGQAKLQSVKQMICNSLGVFACFTCSLFSFWGWSW